MAEVIVVTSGKGGVGKTTTTANLGTGLAKLDKKVVLVDTDIGLRNLDVVLGLENRIVYNLVDVVDGNCKITQALIKDKKVDGLYLLPAAQTRDKDAVTASVMAVEMASYHALRGKTLLGRLEELYALLGHYAEETVSLVMPGVDGLEKMRALMERLRRQPPRELSGEKVLRLRDYQSGEALGMDGSREELPLKGANLLAFDLASGSSFLIRPSGTEPKIKCYLLLRGETRAECEARREKLAAFAAALGEG